MNKLIFCLFFFLSVYTASASETDTLSFIKTKRMSDSDLEKKREGTFFTGIPDISSDPVTGFGVGVRGNIYWNGDRSNELFPYTPYLAKLKTNVAYFTTNARELALSLDIPYYQGTRWRFKIDVKAQQNPANQYFGLSESTLQDLQLITANNGQSYSTFEDFETARNTVRRGNNGEAPYVTDVLANQFRETEFMLNLKADYALGDGSWRIMGGYEIQHLSYTTFEGTETDAVDSNGNTVKVPNGNSLLHRDFKEGRISGLSVDGGWVSILQTALIYDTRDFEPDPTNGAYFEIANEYSGSAIGSQFNFNKLFIQGRYYQKIPIGPRTILAGRLGVGNIFGDEAPFFEFQDQWSPDGSINALGGRQSLRGYRANRFLSRSMWFSNVELRARILDFSALNQNFGIGIAPFVDFGTVRDHWEDLNLNQVKFSFGSGLRIAWNQSTILSLDYGVSAEDKLFFFGIGQAF